MKAVSRFAAALLATVAVAQQLNCPTSFGAGSTTHTPWAFSIFAGSGTSSSLGATPYAFHHACNYFFMKTTVSNSDAVLFMKPGLDGANNSFSFHVLYGTTSPASGNYMGVGNYGPTPYVAFSGSTGTSSNSSAAAAASWTMLSQQFNTPVTISTRNAALFGQGLTSFTATTGITTPAGGCPATGQAVAAVSTNGNQQFTLGYPWGFGSNNPQGAFPSQAWGNSYGLLQYNTVLSYQTNAVWLIPAAIPSFITGVTACTAAPASATPGVGTPAFIRTPMQPSKAGLIGDGGNASWVIVPPLNCGKVPAGFSLQLASTTTSTNQGGAFNGGSIAGSAATYLYLDGAGNAGVVNTPVANGPLTATTGPASAGTLFASLVNSPVADTSATLFGQYATVNGISGWIIYSYDSWQTGLVLTRNAGGVCTGACCADNNAGTLTGTLLTSAGPNINQLWRLPWQDNAQDINTGTMPMPVVNVAANIQQAVLPNAGQTAAIKAVATTTVSDPAICVPGFASFGMPNQTHSLTPVTIYNRTNGFGTSPPVAFRHAGGYIYMQNPTGGTCDSYMYLRPGLDGANSSWSIMPVFNYANPTYPGSQAQYLGVSLAFPGYVLGEAYSNATYAWKQGHSWTIPSVTFGLPTQIYSNSIPFKGQPLNLDPTGLNARGGQAGFRNGVVSSANTQTSVFTLNTPFMGSPSCYNALQATMAQLFMTNNVWLTPGSLPKGTWITAVSGCSATSNSTCPAYIRTPNQGPINDVSSTFTIVPSLQCGPPNTFSLQWTVSLPVLTQLASGNTGALLHGNQFVAPVVGAPGGKASYLYITATGAVGIAPAANNAALSVADATYAAMSLIGTNTIINGVSGWIISSMASNGYVLSRNPTGTCVGTCCTDAAGTLTSVSAANTMTINELWRITWTDNGVDLAAIPTTIWKYNTGGQVLGSPTTTNTPSPSVGAPASSTATPATTVYPTPEGTPTTSASIVPGSSPSPSSCPASFGLTHLGSPSSIQWANNTNIYVRHCGYWLFGMAMSLSGLGVMDGSQIMRWAADGSGGVSFQSVNYGDRLLSLAAWNPTFPNYLQYMPAATMLSSQNGMQNASWTLVPSGISFGGIPSYRIFTNSPQCPGCSMQFGINSTNGQAIYCNGYPNNMYVARPTASADALFLVGGGNAAASASLYTTTGAGYEPGNGNGNNVWMPAAYPYSTNRVFMTPLGATGGSLQGAYVGACNGALVVNTDGSQGMSAMNFPFVSTNMYFGARVESFLWNMAPAINCPTSCAGTTMSFAQTGAYVANGYMYTPGGTAGPVISTNSTPGNGLGAAFDPASSSYIVTPVTVFGVSGYTIAPLTGYTNGVYLKFVSTPSCTGACCTSTSVGSIVAAPLGVGGVTLDYVFSFAWEDTPSYVTTLPSVAGVSTQPNCPSPSTTPSPSLTGTGSKTATASSSTTASSSQTGTSSPSNTGSLSSTPSRTSSVSSTASSTASSSTTASGTAAITVTPAITTSSAPTSSATASASASQTASATYTPTSSLTEGAAPSATSSVSGTAAETASGTSAPSVTPAQSISASTSSSASVSGSVTAAATQSRSGSPAGTQTRTSTPAATDTPSNTASASITRSATPSSSTTKSPASTRSSTAAASITATPTVSPASNVAIAGSLLVELDASDFDASLSVYPRPVWDNRVTFGPTSYTNGDFVSTSNVAASWPTAVTLGGNNAPAVWFDGAVTGVASRMQSSAVYFPSNTIFSSSDWSLEAWVWTNGWENPTYENSFFQWGPRGGTTPNCASAGFGLGSSTSWGAASFWNCDVPYAAQSVPIGSVSVGNQGYKPSPYMWHHYVATFSGSASIPANQVIFYVDGLKNTQATKALAVLYSGGANTSDLVVGTFSNGAASQIGVGKIRLHNGVMTASQVAANYNLEVVTFQATPTSTQIYSLSPTSSSSTTPSTTSTPSSSPSPSICPNTFAAASTTHSMIPVSLYNITNGYGTASPSSFRHCGNYIYQMPGGGCDAIFYMRPGLDGALNSWSFQALYAYGNPASAGSWLSNDLASPGYVAARGFNSTIESKQACSWTLPTGATIGSTVQVLSNSLPSTGLPITNDPNGVNLKGCGQPGYRNGFLTNNNTANSYFTLNPPQTSQSTSCYSTTGAAATATWMSNNVWLLPRSLPSGQFVTAVSGCTSATGTDPTAFVRTPTGGPINNAGEFSFTIVPPADCTAFAGQNMFSLRLTSSPAGPTGTYLSISSAGVVGVLAPSTGAATLSSATLFGQYTTVNGVSGWVISSVDSAAAGIVLSRNPDASTCVGACCAAAAGSLSAIAPAAGLTVNELWRLTWQDNGVDLASLPSALYAAQFPPVVPSGTPTASWTPSSTASSSTTASSTSSGSSTLTSSPALTVTATATPSATSSASTTSAVTTSPAPTSSTTPSSSTTAAVTTTPALTTTPASSLTSSVSGTPEVTTTPASSSTSSVSGTPAETTTPAVTSSPAATSSKTGTRTRTPSRTPAESVTSSSSGSASGSSSGSSSASSSPSSSSSVSVTGTPPITATRSAARTVTSSPAASSSPAGTPAATNSITFTPTKSQGASPTPTGAKTVSPTGTSAKTITPASTSSPHVTTTPTGTKSPTTTPTHTKTGSSAATRSSTDTPAATRSKTGTPAATKTKTGTKSPAASKTSTPAVTKSPASTKTPAASKTGTAAATKSPASTKTPAASKTGTAAATATRTKTK